MMFTEVLILARILIHVLARMLIHVRKLFNCRVPFKMLFSMWFLILEKEL